MNRVVPYVYSFSSIVNLAPLAVSLASDGSITIVLLYSTALTTVTSNSCLTLVPLAVAVIFALPAPQVQ